MGKKLCPYGRPNPVNDIFFFCGKLILQITNGFVYITQLLSLNRLARRLLTICKKSWQRPNNSDSRKEGCIKVHVVSDLLYVSCFYLTS